MNTELRDGIGALLSDIGRAHHKVGYLEETYGRNATYLQ